ncbi:MAG: formate dehydrogenase subunit delta, partial [Proteobacteria bacterium]|nr:formate dehydrogenase subunit delta [Pseudomonadota bacterium]
MDLDNLVRMANRIGDYFAAYPDQAEAQAAIAKHIQMFWT